MNCKKANQQIHLFAELTDQERDQLFLHIRECEQCKQLSESMDFMNNSISRIAKIPAEPTDSFLLTNRIMCEVNIPEHKPLNVVEWVLSYVELGQLKLTMAGISVLLIFLFSFEQNQSAQVINQYSSELSSNSTVLNARNFQDQLNKYRTHERMQRVKGCKDPFTMSQRSMACLREKNARFKTL